jgi:uncharacterized membrane protein (DUF485 family)
MSRPGKGPSGPVGRSPEPPRHARLQPSEALRLDALRRGAGRLNRRLITINAVCFGVLVLLAGAAPGLLATEVFGRVNLGLLLCAALGVLAFCASVGYDRRFAREYDAEADRIRAGYEERVAASSFAPATHHGGPGQRGTEW